MHTRWDVDGKCMPAIGRGGVGVENIKFYLLFQGTLHERPCTESRYGYFTDVVTNVTANGNNVVDVVTNGNKF